MEKRKKTPEQVTLIEITEVWFGFLAVMKKRSWEQVVQDYEGDEEKARDIKTLADIAPFNGTLEEKLRFMRKWLASGSAAWREEK